MWQTALNTIGTAAVAALVTVICVAIKSIGGAAANLIGKKAAAWEVKIGADAYNHSLVVTREMWGAVAEEVRTNPELQKLVSKIEVKQQLFTQKIQKAIPGLTDDEIVQLRQAVAGEVNKGKAAIESPTDPESAADQAIRMANEAVEAANNATQPAPSENGAVAPSATGAV